MVANVGAPLELSFPVQELGMSAATLDDFVSGKHPFAKVLQVRGTPACTAGRGAVASSQHITASPTRPGETVPPSQAPSVSPCTASASVPAPSTSQRVPRGLGKQCRLRRLPVCLPAQQARQSQLPIASVRALKSQ